MPALLSSRRAAQRSVRFIRGIAALVLVSTACLLPQFSSAQKPANPTPAGQPPAENSTTQKPQPKPDESATAPASKVEPMAGQIVAFSNGLACLNGNAYWSMLVHVQDHATDVPSQFVAVRFSLACNKSPEWINRKSSLQNFRLTRDAESDSVLKEFIDCATESPGGHAPELCAHVPMWKRVPGADPEKLPFGQRVPSYRSVDLLLAPAV